MSKTGVGGTGDPAVDPKEETATRTRSPFESADDSWDLDEPVATKVATIPPPPVEENDALGRQGAESTSVAVKSVNPSKFPSAMAELSKSDPALRAAKVVPSTPPSAAKTSTAKPSAAKTSTAKPKASEQAVEPTVEPPVTKSVTKDESVAVAAVIDIGSGTAKSESKLEVVPRKVAVSSPAKSESKLEVVKAEVSDSPSGHLKAARLPQESLLSLESEYVVEFFSSPPPAVSPHVVLEFEPEIELVQPSRSMYPADQLAERRRHFRKVVVRVMFVALVLFGVSLYVLWRRGMFTQMGQ